MNLIAVDGPGGAGKSTVSRKLAERLGWLHLDTGAYYRAATLAALRAGVDLEDEDEVLEVVKLLRLRQEHGLMLLNGEAVSEEIRSAEVTAAASTVAAHGRVRAVIVRQQRQWVAGQKQPVVVEGRDIGTVVFPAAELKIWLEASESERVRRRAEETGQPEEEVEGDLARRDHADASRAASPSRPAADAIRLDTTNLGVEAVVARIVQMLPVDEVFRPPV
ncbi:MAG: (d)CMP kinase [Acidimicrobiia bacterium]|nr:(d)CMP kinase [Acidimicrobiia bacterium]MDQ3500107.1 (d)CMP kinase [Actinomycetota bacterium]